MYTDFKRGGGGCVFLYLCIDYVHIFYLRMFTITPSNLYLKCFGHLI